MKSDICDIFYVQILKTFHILIYFTIFFFSVIVKLKKMSATIIPILDS